MKPRRRIKWKKYFWWIFLIVLFPFTLLLYWGNLVLSVTRLRVKSDKLPASFAGFKIVLISDLHNTKFGKNQSRLLKKTEALTPDVIAVTGDLIDSNRTNVEAAVQFIRGASKIAPVYYVTGNHESRTGDYSFLKEKLISAGVTILDDGVTSVTRAGQTVYLAGLQAPEFTMRKKSEEEKRAAVGDKLQSLKKRADGFTVLLSHHPELFDLYVSAGFDVALCGHAHGGQIRLPFVGGILSPNQGLFPKYTAGIYQKGNTKMIVSRGLGNSAFPLRINNFPEIVSITLEK